jgi:hypothetical protein
MSDSSVSTIIGAIVGGFIGGVFVLVAQYNQRQDELKAAGRGLLAEMMNNANLALRGIMSAPVTYPEHFSIEVWTGQLPLVAQLLSWTDLDKIRDAYDIQSSVLETINATAKATAERNFNHAALIMADGFGALANRLVTAIVPLADAVLANDDRREIGKQIRELESKVKTQLETTRKIYK